MLSQLEELFDDPKTISKIKAKLPYLFKIAELDSSRTGKDYSNSGEETRTQL